MKRQRPTLILLGILGTLILLGVLGALSLWLSRPDQAIQQVILISIDTLRADHLPSYGYEKIRTPHIERLAREGIVFENAATVTPLTLPAHACLISLDHVDPSTLPAFTKTVRLTLNKNWMEDRLRAVIWIQGRQTRRVLAAARVAL